jgi:hypothetical protein
VIFTATPTSEARGSVRTTSPRHLNIILPPGRLNSNEKLIDSPGAQTDREIQKNTPEALTSRVTPPASFRYTGNAV